MDPAFPSLTTSRSIETFQERKFRKIFAETSATLLARGETKRTFKCFRKQNTEPERKMNILKVKLLMNELILCCLTHMQDTYRMHLSRLRGLKIIDSLATHCSINKIDADHATHLTWAILSCLHHFFVRLRTEKGCMEWFKRRQARAAIKTYDRLLVFLAPLHFDVVFSAITTFLEEADLWDIEYFCANVLNRILLQTNQDKRGECILDIISLVEDSTLTNVIASREILQVLITLGQSQGWTFMDGRIITRYIEMYAASLVPEENHGLFEALEKSLAASLQAMSMHLGNKYLEFMVSVMFQPVLTRNMTGNNLYRYGEMLEYIHTVYTRKLGHHSLSDFSLPAIIRTISSNNLVHSQLGLRLLHSFIDRCGNKWQFETPKIFLRDTKYNIIINEYKPSDKAIFQRYREKLHETSIDCVLKHGVHKIYVESLYICIALFLVEIPCAYTAAAGLCLALTLQQVALLDKSLPITYAHRIHATVISVISLICYIHKAEVLYDYLETILEKRSSFAPHLNPPLKMNYNYAQHHILWDDPEFFFQDWKVRYGMWRCFKTKHKNIIVQKKDLMNLPLTNLDIEDNF